MATKRRKLTTAQHVRRMRKTIKSFEECIFAAKEGELGRSDQWREGMIRFWQKQIAELEDVIVKMLVANEKAS